MAAQYKHLPDKESSHEDLLSSTYPAYLTTPAPDTDSAYSPVAFSDATHHSLTWPGNRDDGFLSPADRDLGSRKDEITVTSINESEHYERKPGHSSITTGSSSHGSLPVQKTIYNFFLGCSQDLWFIECVVLWISLAAMIGMFMLLHTYNGYPSSTKFYGLHVNSWISGLNTVSKAAMIYPVAGAMGQCIWLWFHNSRPLNDLGKFDSASQDPKEAAFLLRSFNAILVGFLMFHTQS